MISLASRRILELLRWEKRLMGRLLLTGLASALAGAAVILLIRDFLSGAIGEGRGLVQALTGTVGPEGALWLTAGCILAAYVAGSLARYDNLVSQSRFVKVVELGFLDRLLRHLLSLSVPYFDRQTHGDMIQAVRQDVAQMRQTVESFANILLHGALAVGLGLGAAWISPWLALWAFVLLPVATLPIAVVARRTLECSYRVRRSTYFLFDTLLEILRSIRILKVYRGEDRHVRSSLERGNQYFDDVIEMVRIRALGQVALESLAGLGIVLVVVVGGFGILRGSLGWEAFLAFLLAARQIQGPLDNVHRNYVQIQSYGASIDRLSRILEARPQVADRPRARRILHPPSRFEFRDVSFAYPGGEKVLDRIRFEVAAGETIGIAGPSGSGKTTLLHLIARFHDPSVGVVLYDGVDLCDYRLADVYDLLAIVTQEPFLFAATVRENIRCGRTGASDDEVEQAGRAANIHDAIVRLPHGYETLLGMGHRMLSGGETQRINIARAVLKNAPILLLDEATSSLDTLAEAEVQRAIDPLLSGRTTFIVAHRLATLRRADRICVLEHGSCVGFDSHESLLVACPLYRSMWDAQERTAPDLAVRSSEERLCEISRA